MKVGKPKSKRVPVRLRHKIQKASANKQRKERKDAKKNPQWRSRLKKDPGIPNLFPYKEKVLAEIEESKRKKEEEKLRRIAVAKAQREGRKVETASEAMEHDGEDEDGELPDPEDDVEGEGADGDEMEEDTNPMAALLASAQARAQTFQADDVDEEHEDGDDGDDDEEVAAPENTKRTIQSKNTTAPARKELPKQALADPIKTVTKLLDRLQRTQEGLQQLLDYYQLPPLVTAGSDTTTRLLVDVARKRGRLGRGGIPNLNAAALTVLSDVNDDRLKLPALSQQPLTTSQAAANKSKVQIVTELAQPFRIEGLFGDSLKEEGSRDAGAMDIET
ncbi:GTPase grn1 [Fulvia fulva]|uniref:GTPase grn1 n=1 Tax=Passalora fulva TaxID=5499 RepID=A0A9Q8L6W5_PASFU|nr:GTPase grn1 [Fulvia fulva]KAK4634828.1 GTPase grn1 [Fulvia fulva]KAK4637724.1 GTPase grn1 [Fulvia fulva]UJO11943.1 GTPase grn1 [Fulvia fulva]WPV09920.1 GTPase grn1 [Fulvia fulva]WPV24304.1 GTPase grn1 [Fulvia fulva]